MGELIVEGKLRGWGMCNDNAYGLTASCYAARSVVGSPGTCQGSTLGRGRGSREVFFWDLIS